MITILHAEFVKGVSNPGNLKPSHVPELAVIGRSNVGKSTLINKLANKKNLARTSSTPGCTREINFFDFKVQTRKKKTLNFHLIDLPGFGYAKASHKEREALRRRISDYLLSQENLKALFLLNDCRRIPEADELEIRDLLFKQGIPVFIVLTKIDKLRKNDIRKQREIIARAYGLEAGDLLLSGSDIDMEAIWERVLGVL